MYAALSPGAVGVKVANLAEAISAAQRGGFEGVEFNVREVADLVDAHGAEHVKGLFAAAGLRPAGWGLPTDWRTTEEKWGAGLEELPRLAAAAAAIGAPRTFTWILPSSNDRTFAENRRFHIERFTPIASILARNDCYIGLEFVGPKTMRDKGTHPFIYRMEDMLALGAEIGPNVGLLLDAFHWYTSHGTIEALRTLRGEQVVYVHVNDAVAGVDVDEQLDNRRALPGETGVIDIAAFLQAVAAIGYDGPVVAEPFKQELNDLPSDDDRLRMVRESLGRIFRVAGLQ